MPRKPRYSLSGELSHVTRRGHNRERCFSAAYAYRCYLQCLREACLKYDASVHACVLGANDSLTQWNGLYLGLAGNAEEPRDACRESFNQANDDNEVQSLRIAIKLYIPAGNERLKAQIECRLEQRISYSQRGRPRNDHLPEKSTAQQPIL